MLPHAYQFPAALFILLGGVLSCFAGYRLFRIVLGIYGFIFGAMIASSVVSAGNTTWMLIAAVVGGVVGSAVLAFAWFIGVALVGAGIGVLAAHLVWSQVGTGDPPAVAIIVASIAGAVGAMFVQRYVIVIGTAFAGAWTILIAATNMVRTPGLTHGSSATEVWILYPTSTLPGRWVPVAWIALGLVGTAVQLSTGGRRRK
jgi:hypothetical protein